MDKQYWVVGATYGNDDQYDRFLKGGFWMLGWEVDDQPVQYELAKRIHEGDRIAIKIRNGRGARDITIRCIGIVKEVVLDNTRSFCTVNWCAKDMDRRVFVHGCLGAIHGPYSMQSEDRSWLQDIFTL